jgi:hypothetical protein
MSGLEDIMEPTTAAGGATEFHDSDEFDDSDYLAELIGEELALDDDLPDLAEVLRGALVDDYADAPADLMEDALDSVLETMTPAESFNFAKALRQIEKGAAQALSDPVVSQFATTALPLTGAAVGTAFGGPAGTAIGSGLGGAAAKAIGGSKPPTAGASPPVASTASSVAGGSPAAARGLVLTQQPDVLKGLLALALGEHGRKTVNGVPVGAIMSMLSSVFGQAAADADELLYESSAPAYLTSGDAVDVLDVASPGDRGDVLYRALLDAENDQLGEAVDAW